MVRKVPTRGAAALAVWLASVVAVSPEVAAPFRVGGVTPPDAAFLPIQKVPGQALGVKVEVVVVDGHAQLIEVQIGRRLDYALYSASAYGLGFRAPARG